MCQGYIDSPKPYGGQRLICPPGLQPEPCPETKDSGTCQQAKYQRQDTMLRICRPGKHERAPEERLLEWVL